MSLSGSFLTAFTHLLAVRIVTPVSPQKSSNLTAIQGLEERLILLFIHPTKRRVVRLCESDLLLLGITPTLFLILIVWRFFTFKLRLPSTPTFCGSLFFVSVFGIIRWSCGNLFFPLFVSTISHFVSPPVITFKTRSCLPASRHLQTKSAVYLWLVWSWGWEVTRPIKVVGSDIEMCNQKDLLFLIFDRSRVGMLGFLWVN